MIYIHKETKRDIKVRRVSAGVYKDVETGDKITRHELSASYNFSKKKSSIRRVQLNMSPYKATLPGSHLIGFKITKVPCGTKSVWRVFFGNEELDTFDKKFEALAFVREKAST